MVAATAASFTGHYLKPLLERASVNPVVEDVKPAKEKRSRKASVEEPDLIGAK